MSREVPQWYGIYHVLDSGFSSPEQEANKTNYYLFIIQNDIKYVISLFSHQILLSMVDQQLQTLAQ